MGKLQIESKIGSYGDSNFLEINVRVGRLLTKIHYDEITTAVRVLERIVAEGRNLDAAVAASKKAPKDA